MSAMQDPPQPSTANIAAACAILGGVTGYFIGQAKSLGLFGGSALSPTRRSSTGKRTEKDDSSDSDDDEEQDDSDDSDDDTAPAEFPGHTEECKMVLVVRTDLGMTKGTSGRHGAA
jgi:PTH2 family peptidyl-tRNA hydrolase